MSTMVDMATPIRLDDHSLPNEGDLNEIPIWSARNSGPVIHFWFKQDGIHRRICDGMSWTVIQQAAHRDLAVPCRICKELYLEDVLRGRKVLTLATSDFTPYNGIGIPYYPVANTNYGVETLKERSPALPRISMAQFARFYEVRPAHQVKIIRDIRMQLANPDDNYMARNFYGFLLQELQRTHWATKDVRDFQDALQSFVNGLKDQRKREPYLAIGNAYIEYWNRRPGELFQVPPVSVKINGLTISVRPEVGIRIGLENEVLKLWLNAKKPSRQTRQVMHYIMDMARSSSRDWPDSWNVGIWDVRRKDVPRPVLPARDFELGLGGQVGSFMQIWETLDSQAASEEMP